MRIAYYSGYSPWWGTYPKDVLDADRGRTVGGGEAGMLSSAFELFKQGDEVVIYACAEPGEYRGVVFKPESDFYGDLRRGGVFDCVVAWSDPKPLGAAPDGAGRILVQQLNDLLFWPGWEQGVDVLVSPSRNHAGYMRRLGWTGTQAVMHNGCAQSQLGPASPPHTRPLLVGYWSSPDRGLHHVLRAWPRVRRAVPGAELRVFYEIEKLFQFVDDQNVSGEAWWRLKTVRDEVLRARADPSVVFEGALSRVRLHEAQKQIRVMCYPSDGLGYTEGFCHPPGTKILTQRGLVPIERITVTDCVLGVSGRWRRVRGVLARRYEGMLHRLHPACGEAVEFTDDHPVLAAPQPEGRRDAIERGAFAWIPAACARLGMYLYSPSGKSADSVSPSITVPKREITEHRQACGLQMAAAMGKTVNELPDALSVMPELCRLLGYFAANGNASTNRGRSAGAFSVACRGDRRHDADDIVGLFKTVLSEETTIRDDRPHKNRLVVHGGGSAACYALRRWTYAEDCQRCLPPWVATLPMPLADELLRGLWRADGSVYFVQGGARVASYTSRSPLLIGQVRALVARLGIRTKIGERRHRNGTHSYQIQFSIAGEFLDWARVGRDERHDYGYFVRATTDGQQALRLRDVTTRQYDGDVFSIAVEEDESYLVGNFIVHNCVSICDALCAGALPLVRPVDALSALWDGAVRWLPLDTASGALEDAIVEETTRGLTTWSAEPRDPTLDAMRARAAEYTWARAGREMHDAILLAVQARRES